MIIHVSNCCGKVMSDENQNTNLCPKCLEYCEIKEINYNNDNPDIIIIGAGKHVEPIINHLDVKTVLVVENHDSRLEIDTLSSLKYVAPVVIPFVDNSQYFPETSNFITGKNVKRKYRRN